jgi:hypothetical protein
MSQGGSIISPPRSSWQYPITYEQSNHPNFIPKSGQYPLIVSPIVKDVKRNRVLVDGGSSLNNLFLNTFDQMGLSRSALHLSRDPRQPDPSSRNLWDSGELPHRVHAI